MTTGKPYLAWLAAIMALAIVLSADALAQKPAPRITVATAVATATEMQLWSFGDCDRRFPYFDTQEHQDCVRVVSSPEAKDARALRVCEVSHQPDENEIERCKGVYYANKAKAARESSVNTAVAIAQAGASPETMRMVKAITSAAVENQQGGVAVAGPPTANPPAPAGVPASPVATAETESSSPMPTIGLALLAVVAVGFGAKNVIRKKQDETADPEGAEAETA